MRFHITIMRPQEEIGRFCSQAFHEVTETLAYALVALGHQVSYKTNMFVPGAQNIVLGPQFATPETAFPEGTILYNLEQIGGNPHMLMSPKLSERYTIWDYSPQNMAYWYKLGIKAEFVPIGYVRQLTRIPPALHPDIDVLFYGTLNERRAKILNELQDKLGKSKVVIMQEFGKTRDEAIARSKLVLNLHYYDSPRLFEWVRVSYLLANMKAVVCEDAEDFPIALVGGVADAPYDGLVDACMKLLGDTELRLQLQRVGFELFSKVRETDILRSALCKTCESVSCA